MPRRSVAPVGATALTLALGLPAGAAAQVPPRPATTPAPSAAPAPPPQPPQQPGRIAGRVVDAATGQPLAGVQVIVDGRPAGAQTDLDGRFRIALPPGTYVLRVRRIGYAPRVVSGIEVRAGSATVTETALTSAATRLTAVQVQAERESRPANDAGLLAIQRKAAAVSDGISAQQIARSPDAGANDAARRITGVSVVEDRYVVVRGLGERYSNTLLNGVEIASPEPTRRIVPLDVFPANLLDAIVVSKAATPDKPGDFAGGSVEIRTKEFPENPIRQVSVSQGWNSRTTFRRLPIPRRTGADWLALDGGGRGLPAGFPANPEAAVPERYAEALRNDWTPAPARALPNVGLSGTLGGQTTLWRQPLGYVASLNYSANQDIVPDRFLQYYMDVNATPQRGFTNTESRAATDLGAMLNVSFRPGGATKLGLRNLYTRSAEDLYVEARGFNEDRNGDVLGYQRNFLLRALLQTQLSGDHLVARLGNLRVEWKASVSLARRDEPQNRFLEYQRNPEETAYRFAGQGFNDLFFRFLDDRVDAATLDVIKPTRWFGGREATWKLGALARDKRREFTGRLLQWRQTPNAEFPAALLDLAPGRLFAPETIGEYLQLFATGAGQRFVDYSADEGVRAAYAMADVPVLARLRVVAGARLEDWRMELLAGSQLATAENPALRVNRRNADVLPSVNATVTLAERMNVRLAAFRTVARPDTREFSPDCYVERAGGLQTCGTPGLRRGLVDNADARWEWYPREGEIVAVSAFAKRIREPVVVTVSNDQGGTFRPVNARQADIRGAELEVRRALDFLPGPLARLATALNYTYSHTAVSFDSTLRLPAAQPFAGQSPHLVNASLLYARPRGGASVSLLYNWFADRVFTYGFPAGGGANAVPAPNIVERGRGTLDAKLSVPLRRRVSLTVTGRNLTDNRVELTQRTSAGRQSVGSIRAGTTLGLGVTYAR